MVSNGPGLLAHERRPSIDASQNLIPSNANGHVTHTTPHPVSHRHLKRAFALLILPIAVACYYYFIWRCFLLRKQSASIEYGIDGEVWIFYSWFIIGVLALEWSRYGLVGVEVSMLESSWFHVPHMLGLLNHSGSMWSGPGGWLRSFTRLVNSSSPKTNRVGWSGLMKLATETLSSPHHWVRGSKRLMVSLKVYRLWYLLAFISFCLYIGLPLSGLTMELSDGYVRLDERPEVVGRTEVNMHLRDWWNYPDRMSAAWRTGSPATLPGIGIIYTPEYIDRDQYDGLRDTPNTLPKSTGVPEMFIAPQATNPVSGIAWGLRVGYNCSIVRDYSEFTLLSNNSLFTCLNNPGGTCRNRYVSEEEEEEGASNVWGYLESAHRIKANYSYPTYDGYEPYSFAPEDVSDGDIFEYVLWQVRAYAAYQEVPNFNTTLVPSIENMPSPLLKRNGTWTVNETYFTQSDEGGLLDSEVLDSLRSRLKSTRTKESLQNVLDVGDPIGVRCLAVSTLGYAKLEPRTSSFHSFERHIPPTYNGSITDAPVPRVGTTVSAITSSTYTGIFASVNSRTMVTMSNSIQYHSFATPQDLQDSIMLAYGVEVLTVMYDGKYGFQGSWVHENLTSSRPSKVLTKGEVPPLVTVIFLGVWAVSSMILAIIYGFRRRSCESLDGFNLFRLGALHASKPQTQANMLGAEEAYQVKELWSLPAHVKTM